MLEYRRKLPHFHPDGAYLFVTWRLWGSLPRTTSPLATARPGGSFVMNDRLLDRSSSGPLWLRERAIATLVAQTLQIGDHERHFYELNAWVVMPNHVHLLILPQTALPVITRWLKGSTARQANQLLARTGRPFWQDESYDHWVRDEQQFNRITSYIEENPVSARLVRSAGLWPWSSAGWAGETACPTMLTPVQM